jgi:hypothetical protein
MDKDKESNFNDSNYFNVNWYEIWMKQSKEFFDSANQHLSDIFTAHTQFNPQTQFDPQAKFDPHASFNSKAQLNPQEQIKQFYAWLETLKNQWQVNQLGEAQKAQQNYWQAMQKMCLDAADLMLKQWMQRNQEDNPIKNVRELYEVWLNCCHEVYAQAMHSKDYQQAYGEFMNASIHFWKAALSK